MVEFTEKFVFNRRAAELSLGAVGTILDDNRVVLGDREREDYKRLLDKLREFLNTDRTCVVNI